MKLFLLLVLYTSLWMVCPSDSAPDSLEAVRQSNWEFTKSLYAAVRKEGKASDNIIFSPFSLQVILAMCYTGASGKTAQQLSKGLGLPNHSDLVKSGFQTLLKSVSTSEKVTVETASIIFPDKSFTVLKNFIEDVNEYFHSDIENVDYNLASEAAETINDWVEKKTHGKISQIVTERALDSSTVMLLINAVYFKGDWLNAFDRTLTSKEEFYINEKDVKRVDMMHSKTWLLHWKNTELGAQMVEIPYNDNSTSLVIILPDQLTGLSSVEAKLERMYLRNVLETSNSLIRKQVKLSLPRFRIEVNKQLKDALKRLGIFEIFRHTADFSKISAHTGLSISKIIHKALLEVNEKGTVAAATTSTSFNARSLDLTTEYVVNHPFTFALVSRRAGVVLFVGRYTGASGKLTRSVNVDIPLERKFEDKDRKGVGSRLVVCSYLWIIILCIVCFVNA